MEYNLDAESFLGTISSVFRLIQGSMALDPEAIQALATSGHPDRLALAIFAVIMLSMGVGQSTILFINQVPPRRFLASLLAASILQGASILLWLTASWLVAHLYFGSATVSFEIAAWIFILGHAPFVLGFLTVVPYIGVFWPHILRAWTLACIAAALLGFGLHVRESLIVAVIGYLVVMAFHRVMRPVLERMRQWAWLHVGGVKTPVRVADQLLAQREDGRSA